MIAATFLLELRRSRSLAAWLVVVGLAYGGLIAVFYPTISSNSAVVDQYLSLFPKEMIAAFGLEGRLADPGIFFNTYIGSMLWPILATIGAVLIATRSAADLDRGWIELPRSTPVPRTRYLGASIAAQLVALAILAAATTGGVLVLGLLVGAPFEAGHFALATLLAFAFGCAIASVATLLAVVTLSRGTAGGIAAGIVIAMYLFEVVARIEPDLAGLGSLSAFHYLEFIPVIDSGALPSTDVAVFAGVSVVSWLLAVLVFRGRDLVA